MINLLLDSTNSFENFIPFIVLGVMFLIAIIIFVAITKRSKIGGKRGKALESEVDTKKSMALKIPFLSNMENNFMYNFQKVLPDEYVVYPKIHMEQLIMPYNNIAFYNIIKYRVLDFVVFLRKNMQPVVVIDIHDRTGVQKSIQEDDKLLSEALRNVGLPIVDYEVSQTYEPAEILGRFLDALDPLAIANLKKNRERF